MSDKDRQVLAEITDHVRRHRMASKRKLMIYQQAAGTVAQSKHDVKELSRLEQAAGRWQAWLDVLERMALEPVEL